MNTLKQAAVYWIRLSEHTDIATQGYVGVSKQPEKRWKQHLKKSTIVCQEKNHLYCAVNKYSWGKLIKETVLYGEESFCYETELNLRPTNNIGWNIKTGGNRLPSKIENPEFWSLREKSEEQKYLEWTQTEEYAEEEFQYQYYLKEQEWKKADQQEQIKLYGYVKYGN